MSQLSEQELNNWIGGHEVAILYFKLESCGVCHVHLPKLQSLAEEMKVGLKVIDLQENPHLSGAQMVFTVPVTKVFYQGREQYKEGAYLDFTKLKNILNQLRE
ncbi:MAG: thioredoxin family protein [Bacteroidales bacterium]|nr:thioredoxin family protein [Bacteroidales bacterium]